MIVTNAQLEELKKQHGSRFVDSLIGRFADLWDPSRGIWIKEEKYQQALADVQATIAIAHPQWLHNRVGPLAGSVKPPEPNTPLQKARQKLHRLQHFSPGLYEQRVAVCATCGDAELDKAGNLARCRATGCAGSKVISFAGVVEKPFLGSPPYTVIKKFSSESPSECFRNKWPLLHFKNESEALSLHFGASGLGDAVVGMYAACGLADATGRKIFYHAHAPAWISRASHPNVIVVNRVEVDIKDYRERKKAELLVMGADGCEFWTGSTFSPDYLDQIARADTRLRWCCKNLSDRLNVPPFTAVRPKFVDRSGARAFDKPTVLLAPFSNYESRDWNKFGELARGLIRMGMGVVGIGSSKQESQLRDLFGPIPGIEFFYGITTNEATSLMLGSKLVIGNDSGIAHLGGMLDVPTIAVHAGSLPHEFLFDGAPSVRSVTADTALPRADHNTGALRSIPVEKVMKLVRDILVG